LISVPTPPIDVSNGLLPLYTIEYCAIIIELTYKIAVLELMVKITWFHKLLKYVEVVVNCCNEPALLILVWIAPLASNLNPVP